MDSYPANLAPAFDEGGGVATPFEEWWPVVKAHFPHVPEEVARDWLHRHWSHSPFGWVPSADYRFRLVQWPSERVCEILTGWNNFHADPADSIAHGLYLAVEHRQTYGYKLADFMVTAGTFPVPPVVVDNSDGHLAKLPGASFPYPAGFLLVEGHRRLNIALYLAAEKQLQGLVPFWLMERLQKAPR